MPNHVTNKMIAVGDAADFLEKIKGDVCLFDFTKIVPKPESIKLPEGCDGFPMTVSDAAELVMMFSGWDVYDYRGRKKTIPDIRNYGHKHKWESSYFTLFERCCKAIMECGYSNWHPWNVVHWGTKWGAYSLEKIDGGLKFQTAWNTPMAIWKAIALKFPEIHLEIEYADEDWGSNCGTITIEDGQVNHTEVNTKEFSFQVLDYTKEEIAEIEEE